MKRSKGRLLVIGVVAALVLALLATYYSDFLGARFITKGSPRVTVRQGEINTLELSPSDKTRKLEICTEKRNIILGRSDFTECLSLKDFVAPGDTKATVVIPSDMPLGSAVVITRIRNAAGELIPAATTDEKITLYVIPLHSPSGLVGSGGAGSGITGLTNIFGGAQNSTRSSPVRPSPFEVIGIPTRSPSSPSKIPRPSSAIPSPIQTLIIPTPTFFELPYRTPPASPLPSPITNPHLRYECKLPQQPAGSASKLPDLLITAIEFPGLGSWRVGDPFHLYITLKNAGTTDVPRRGFDIAVDYGRHTFFWGQPYDYSPYPLYLRQGGEFKAGESRRLSARFANNTSLYPRKDHIISIQVDTHYANPFRNNQVAESDESNNWAICTFYVWQ